MWFIAYHHSLRPNEAGIKFVANERATTAEQLALERLGYVITRVAPTFKSRMDAFLDGTLLDPEQPVLG